MTENNRRPTNAHARPDGLPERIQHYINGQFVDSAGGATFDVIDPVTNEPYIKAAAGQKEDIDDAVATAQLAFQEGPWPNCCRGSAPVC